MNYRKKEQDILFYTIVLPACILFLVYPPFCTLFFSGEGGFARLSLEIKHMLGNDFDQCFSIYYLWVSNRIQSLVRNAKSQCRSKILNQNLHFMKIH
jgi:hypothetical protein